MHRLEALTAKVPLTIARAPMLQRKCRCGNHTASGGECEICRRARTDDRAVKILGVSSNLHQSLAAAS